MSLVIYNRADIDSLPQTLRFVSDIETSFNKEADIEHIIKNMSVEEFNIVSKIMFIIEEVTFTEDRQLLCRRGYPLNIQKLSTGCKGILLLYLNKCDVLDTLELGDNALDQLILNCTRGIILREPPYTWWPIYYSDDIELSDATKIDIRYHDKHFLQLADYNDYVEYWR